MTQKQTGYLALIDRYKLRALPNYCVSYISTQGARRTNNQADLSREEIYPTQYEPGSELGDLLEFALKYEGTNLEILSQLFQKIDEADLLKHIQARPTGKYSRRIWFLYEFLTEKTLAQLDDVQVGNYIDLLEKDEYYTSEGIPCRRQRINNNLLGTKNFSPQVRKTDRLREFEEKHLDARSVEIVKKYPRDVIARAIHYLYTKETKSSFQIEREEPDETRISRFVTSLRSADKGNFVTKENLIKLQNQIVDERFAESDYRKSQNYVGESIDLHREIIHYVSPKPDDLPSLMDGLIQCNEQLRRSQTSPVVHAAAISFGFVFIHPFEDGNGRIHRFLIHHILASRGYTPKEVVFPISATILRRIRDYDTTLESYSVPLMPLMNYEMDSDGSMNVMNETVIYYRFIDMTSICESLFDFLEETIDSELPDELNFLVNYDYAKKAMQKIVDMPDRKIDLFIKLCIQNAGYLSSGKRKNVFSMLTDDEVSKLESVVQKYMAKKQSKK